MKKKYFTEEERKQAKKEWYEKNPDYNRNYYKQNKNKLDKKNKQYTEEHRLKINQYQKEWRKEHQVEQREYNKKYRKNHQKEIKINNKKHYETKGRIRIRKRYHDDIDYKLKCSLRRRLNNALHNNQKSGSAVKDLGCSIPELKTYLESKFQEGMSWNNHGEWHIDHIIPLCNFDLTNREEFLKACHYTNLQPLWANDNYIKSNKLEVFETSK